MALVSTIEPVTLGGTHMVSSRTKSSSIQKSLVDQAIQILTTLPDRAPHGSDSTESSTHLSEAAMTSH